MDLPSIRRLALRDIDEQTLRALAEHGEDLLVERKREPPQPPRLGEEAASFANTLGGFILLGVDDDGRPHGWDPGRRVDLQSHLGALLRAQVDPLPPFVAERRELDGKPVAVVKLFESADAPHLVRGTGALYVRTSKGKEPVDDQRLLLELARRGEHARAGAATRLNSPLVVDGLDDPDTVRTRSGDETTVLQTTVRAAPLTVPPSTHGWPTSEPAGAWAGTTARTLLGGGHQPSGLFAPVDERLEPHPDGVVAHYAVPDIVHGGALREAVAVADAAGVIGAAIVLRPGRGSTIRVDVVARDQVRPLLDAVHAALEQAEAIGRAIVRTTIRRPSESYVHEERRTAPAWVVVDRDLTVPASSDELDDVVHAWARAYRRAAGIPDWDARD